MNLAIRRAPQCKEAAQHYVFHTNIDSVEGLDAFPYIKHVENVADSESQPPTPPVALPDKHPSASAPLEDNIAEPWEPDAQGCLEKKLQSNPYYLFAMGEKYNYIRCGIRKKQMKTYSDNVLKKGHTALLF